MTRRQFARLEMLRSIAVWEDLQVPEILGVPRAAAALDTLSRLVDHLAETATRQLGIANGLAGQRAGARNRLAAQLSLIARAARLLEREKAGRFAELRMPRPRTEPRLLAAGELFIELTAPHADAFIGYGLPVTFLADLRAGIEDLRGVIAEAAENRTMSAAAQTDIPATFAEAMAAVRTLELALAIRFPDRPALLLALMERKALARRRRPGRRFRKKRPRATSSQPAMDGAAEAPGETARKHEDAASRQRRRRRRTRRRPRSAAQG